MDLEANQDVPKMKVFTECLLHEERKLNDCGSNSRTNKATAQGAVLLEMKLPDGKTRKYKLVDVLYVPKLSYSLLRVSQATESGKIT